MDVVTRDEAVGVDGLASRASEAATWFKSGSGLGMRRAQGARGFEGTGGARVGNVGTRCATDG